MAKTGLTDLFYCLITETETNGVITEALGEGKVLGQAVRVAENIQVAEAKLYANNGVAESVRRFVSGDLTIEFDNITDETYAEIHGASTDDEEGDIIDSGDDNPPFMRIGTIFTEIKNNVPKYRGVVYLKSQLKPPNDEVRTQGENIELGTFTETATLMRNADKNWRRSKRFDTYAEALAYIKKYTNCEDETPPTEGQGGGT